MFLDEAQLVKLTGFRQKSKQIAQLRKMGVPFLINASGHPVVTEINAKESKPEVKTEWRPAWAGSRALT